MTCGTASSYSLPSCPKDSNHLSRWGGLSASKQSCQSDARNETAESTSDKLREEDVFRHLSTGFESIFIDVLDPTVKKTLTGRIAFPALDALRETINVIIQCRHRIKPFTAYDAKDAFRFNHTIAPASRS